MTPDDVIKKAYLHGQGKAVPPVAGTPKYVQLLAILDSMQKMWANDPDVDFWDSLYERRALTETASETDTIALDADIDRIVLSEDDPVVIASTKFTVVRPSQLYKYRTSDAVAKVGHTLKFSRTLSSALAGEDIEVPAVIAVPDITDGTAAAQIVVNDPMWLAYASGAEFARNNIVKSSQYDNLLALAEQSMQRMKANNTGALEEVSTPWTPAGESWT